MVRACVIAVVRAAVVEDDAPHAASASATNA
jgi:hypothetical protein